MKILYHHRTQGRHVEAVHIQGIVRALLELGHDVDVVEFPGVRSDASPSHPAGASRAGVMSGFAQRLSPAAFTLLELAYNAFTLLRIGPRLLLRRPGLIYERYALFLFATVLLSKLYRIPIVLEINDSAVVDRVRPLRFPGIANAVERWCFRNATGLVFISHRFHALAVEHHGRIAPHVVSPNAVDSDTFDPAKFDRPGLRRQAGVDGCVVVGYVGGFVHWHGVHEYVLSIGERLREDDRLRLLLVGDGVDYDPIARFVEEHGLSDRVLLPGRLAHDAIPAAIACMDFAILPNSNEYGSPMKLFEFMAMEVPVLAPDYGPVREVIRHGVTGWLFPRNDYAAAVAATITLAGNDPATIRKIGQQARAYVRAERRWVDNARQALSLVLPKASP